MKKCLCCGKEIKETAKEGELTNSWHFRCVRKFFGTNALPVIDLSEEVLLEITKRSTEKGYTVPGVQKKLSLHLSNGDKNEKPRLTIVNYPTGYILKPQTDEYSALPEAEHLVMSMAKEVGISTVPFALLQQEDSFAYITKRIDRKYDDKNIALKMLAMEDFCQLDEKLTQDKYRGSYERCGKIVSRYSSRAGLDKTELFLRIVFSYVVGNSDMHLKNFSLIETDENSKQYILSDAYDILPVNVILPEDNEEMALTLNGKKRNITRNDLIELANNYQIDSKTASNLIDSVLKKKNVFITLCRDSYMPESMKEKLEELIEARSQRLAKKHI